MDIVIAVGLIVLLFLALGSSRMKKSLFTASTLRPEKSFGNKTTSAKQTQVETACRRKATCSQTKTCSSFHPVVLYRLPSIRTQANFCISGLFPGEQPQAVS